MDRRSFLSTAGLGLAGARFGGLSPWTQVARHPLPRPVALSPRGRTLSPMAATVDLGLGTSRALTFGGTAPAPLLRVRRGEQADVVLHNQLDEPTILHWHGLDVPEAADGHPRLAIGPGEEYHYRFRVDDPAGTYWYHPHPHGRTAPQTYLGLAGLLIVEDEREDALGLPTGEREIPLILQDKRLGDGTELLYAPAMGPDRMYGYLGDTAFGNGVADPTVTVAPARYRLRVLNGSNARIFELTFGPDRPFTLVGTDGGLLDVPMPLERIVLGTGERADLLVDFSDARPGSRIMLRSASFEVPGMMGGRGMMGGMGGRGMGGRGPMGMGGGGLPQGAAMDLVEFVVGDTAPESPPPLPSRLSELAPPSLPADIGQRTFRFESMMMSHTIDGRSFEMDRIDHRIRRGRPEIWTFVNESGLPHPVHVHAGQFRVVERRGGRGRVMPWETGRKDTVLVFPGEEVDVLVRFTRHPGRFLLHCHNLEHEDMGMMANFEVVE